MQQSAGSEEKFKLIYRNRYIDLAETYFVLLTDEEDSFDNAEGLLR